MGTQSLRLKVGSIYTKGPGKIYYFRYHVLIAAYSSQEEKLFDELDLSISEQDFCVWGEGNYDYEKELNFDPRTGGPYRPEREKAPSLAQEIQDDFPSGSTPHRGGRGSEIPRRGFENICA